MSGTSQTYKREDKVTRRKAKGRDNVQGVRLIIEDEFWKTLEEETNKKHQRSVRRYQEMRRKVTLLEI